MHWKWLHKKSCERLIIFCNGWGMDEKPFVPLSSLAWDVLMFYDYADLKMDIAPFKLADQYKEIVLVGWSMGVLAGQQLFGDHKNIFRKRIAINGTLCPIDDTLGIPVDIFRDTLLNYNKATKLKFYRRMCKDKGLLRIFLKHQPVRNVNDQKEELTKLIERQDCLSAETSIYTDIIISDKDFIIPTENQFRFWSGTNINTIKGSHFPFYGWQKWDEIVDTGQVS